AGAGYAATPPPGAGPGAAAYPTAPPGTTPSSYSRPPGAGPASYNGPPPPQGPQQGYGAYGKPAPASYNGQQGMPGAGPQQQQQQQQAAPAGTTPEQAALIQQVLSMTDAQIQALDENSRNTILQIRQQAQRAMGR
ncbi:uncharacterized protein JCM10292_006658, partial [Rhodotorula paludigena]|uniref:uncharacterized protein n=1 Tax=Rhodotorula paludigena TaxID=86838 RepID=UPI003174734E